MKKKEFTIKKAALSSSSINIEWEDNQISHFHFLWLRDNCPTAIHPYARQRTFNLLDVSENIYPINLLINLKGDLVLNWSEQNHQSIYSAKWLRDNCYTIHSKSKYTSPYILWNYKLKNELNKITIEYQEVMDTDNGLLKWLEQLHHYGFSIVKNTPVKKKSALKILNRISHIRETFFSTPFEVINIPKPNNAAYTSKALRSHTDLPYYEYAPGYQFLHCIENSATGGMSSSVDGFAVANYLRDTDKDIFKLLITTPVKFKDNDYTQNKIRMHRSPLINLNNDGDFNDIRFNMSAMGILDIDNNLMEKFYLAYRKLAKLFHDPKFVVNFKLNSGDIFSFNNRRVLHGRTEFNPNSGHRHLQGYYLDQDEIFSRLNYLKKINV